MSKKKSSVSHAKLAKTRKRGQRQGAVAQVWAIANKLGVKAERNDVLAACEKAGLNKATAATQFQAWRHATPAQRREKVEGAKKSASQGGREQRNSNHEVDPFTGDL